MNDFPDIDKDLRDAEMQCGPVGYKVNDREMSQPLLISK